MAGLLHGARTQVREWPGLRSEYSWLPPGDGPTVTGPYQVGVSFSSHRGAVFESAGRAIRGDIAAASVFVTGAEPIAWLRIRETAEAMELYPDQNLLRALLPDEPRLTPAAGVHDGVVLGVCSVLRRVHLTGAGLSDVGASTLAHRVAEHLAVRYGRRGRAAKPAPGRLEWTTVNRVTEFVEAHLAGPLTIDRMAAVAGLSPFHFARAFRAATGQSPRQFVMARRMQRATMLLLGAEMSVLDVAHAVGLANTSHFRRVFFRHTGLLPGQLREDRKIGHSRRRPVE